MLVYNNYSQHNLVHLILYNLIFLYIIIYEFLHVHVIIQLLLYGHQHVPIKTYVITVLIHSTYDRVKGYYTTYS